MIFELKRTLFKDDFSVLLIELNTQLECLTKIDIDDLIYQLFDKTIPRVGYRRSYRDLVCSDVYYLENGNLGAYYFIPDSFYNGIAKDVEKFMAKYFEVLNNSNLVSKDETAKYMEEAMTKYFEVQVLNNK